MREKTNANGTGGTSDARGCERAEQLVAYIYGESSPVEDADFRRHLAACAVCGEELASFETVRDGLGEWREEVMRSIPALNVAERIAPLAAAASEVDTHASRTTHARRRKRSASAALREFFSLSPMWLRFATATAVLVFCALAGLTIARTEVRWDSNGFAFNTGVKERVVEKQVQTQTSVPKGFTQEQVDALVRQSVEREVADARARWESEGSKSAAVVNASVERHASPSRNTSGTIAAGSEKGSRRLSRGGGHGEQLADKEDVFYPGEESVPRLTDILGAVKSQGKENER
jgi:anti-sigma factor RsiW